MASLAEYKTAYHAINRVELHDDVAAAVSASSVPLDHYIAKWMARAAFTTTAAIALPFLITGRAPTSDELDALKLEADHHYKYSRAIGAATPGLGPFEALGKRLAETVPAFADRFEDLSDADFIAQIYSIVFRHAPSEIARDNFLLQLRHFETSYREDGIENPALLAKGATFGQIVGYAFVDPSAAAAARIDDAVNEFIHAAARGDSEVYGRPLTIPKIARLAPEPPQAATA